MNGKDGKDGKDGVLGAASGGLTQLSSGASKIIDGLPLPRSSRQALQSLAEDVLRSQDVFIRVRSHLGFPSDVDSLAYDPQSKLLAVGTCTGMVKVIGSDGVECMVLGAEAALDDCTVDVCEPPRSPFSGPGTGPRASVPAPCPDGPASPSRTAYLGFINQSLLHVSTTGRVRLCQLDGCDVQELLLGGRQAVSVRGVALVGNYLVVGCDADGLEDDVALIHIRNCCRVVHVKPGGVGRGEEIVVKPYKIFADQDLEAAGRLVCLESISLIDQGRPILLFVYEESGALVYDVRAERVLCIAGADESGRSAARRRVPTCACWLGAANCFAIGYKDGSATVWGVSSQTVKANPMRATASNTREDAVRILDIEVAEGTQRGSIRSMTYLPAGPGTPHGRECLLMLGGQDAGQPDMLSLVSLEPAGWSREDIVTIPWFGNIISYSMMRDENKIMILTEGGQLVVHDLSSWEPLPVSLKFQELPPLTSGMFLPSVHSSGFHVPSLKNLRFLSWKHVDDSKWPFSGGTPPANYFVTEADYINESNVVPNAKKYTTHPSGSLLYGHRDGRVRVWDATSEVPKHMTTVPSDLRVLKDEGRLMPVACVDACPLSGLLAVGHEGGMVRVYQFSTTPQSVRQVSLTSTTAMPYDTQIDQNPGWQYLLSSAIHMGRHVTAVRLSSREQALAVGDDAGNLSIIDLRGPTIKIEQRLGASKAVKDIKFAVLETGECAVFCLCKDGALEVLQYGAASGKASTSGRSLLPKPLKPKNDSSPLHFALLDMEGRVIPPLAEGIELTWADNSAVERPRTLGMTKLSNFSQGRALSTPARNFEAADALEDTESDDSEFGDIDTSADLWSGVPVPKAASVEGEGRYPNDSFYANFLKRNMTAVCTFVFVASSDSLRLYSLESMIKGERSPLKKVRFGGAHAVFSGSFHSVSGSGAIVTTKNAVQCFTLPGLEEVGRTEDCVIPGLASDTAATNTKPWTVALDGHMVLTSSTNELIRYSTLVRAPLPAGPVRLVHPRSRNDRYDGPDKIEGSVEIHENDRNTSALQGLNNIIGTVKGAAVAASGLVAQSGNRDLPSVADVFQKEVAHLDEEIPQHEDEGVLASKPIMKGSGTSVTPSAKAPPMDASRSTPLSNSAKLRTDLLGPRSKSAKKPARRTVSTVKRQYGVTSKASDSRSVAEDTRRALAERGEKLSILQDKADVLSNEAEDFSSMAKELEQAFEKKRWF